VTAVADAAGTLHAVWRYRVPIHSPVYYCRVPAGGGGCAPVEITRNAISEPVMLVRPQDGALIALVARLIGVDTGLYVTASVDGGATWSPPGLVAPGPEDIDAAALTPDGAAIDVVGSGGGEYRFQRIPLGGGVETRAVALGERRFAPGHIAHLSDGRPVFTGDFVVNQLQSRVGAGGVDPNTPAAWGDTHWRRISGVDRTALDGGPTGTWLLTLNSSRSQAPAQNDYAMRLWRWGSGGFELARRLGALNRPQSQPIGYGDDDSAVALDADLAGRLHAVWSIDPPRCGGQYCLVYRRTDRGGFGAPVSYPVGRETILDHPVEIVVAANSGGSGWIVWGAGDTIRAVPLVTPPPGARVGSLRIGRRRVSIPDFYACIPTGSVFKHRLKLDGRRGTKIASVRFFFDDGQPTATDPSSPYRRDFILSFAPGTRHVAGAVVSYRLPGSRRLRTVRIGRTFVMC